MLEYKIDGPALRDGIPLHIATASLDYFQAVLDKTYLIAVGSKKMSGRDRNVFQLSLLQKHPSALGIIAAFAFFALI